MRTSWCFLSDLGAGIVIDNSGVNSVVTVTETGGEITTIVVEAVDLVLDDLVKLQTL